MFGQQTLLERNPAMARTRRDRFPCIDTLIQAQSELLRRQRAGDTDEASSRPSPHDQPHCGGLAKQRIGKR
jgi:phosphoenolpyruvate carboxylase